MCTNAWWYRNPYSFQELTIPPKNYKDSVDISLVVKRKNNRFPLSDQKNKQRWKLSKQSSDELERNELDETLWYPSNPTWKGRKPTYFHGANVR